MEKNDKKKSLFSSFEYKLMFIIMITIVISGATTYGFFYSGKTQTGDNTLTTSCFDVTFEEGTSINLSNAISMSDASGQKVAPYSFTLNNTCDTEANYYVILSTKTGSFSNEFVNISLNKSDIKTLSTSRVNNIVPVDAGYTDSYIISTGSLKKGEEVTIDLRAWVNSSTTYEDVAGKTWEGQVRVINTVKALDDQRLGFIPKLVTAMLDNEPVTGVNGETPTFANPATTNEGVFAMEDDYGTSYYYRGAVDNNYLKFGQNASGEDMWWRIIRVNGDGSLRIQYDGAGAAGETTYTRGFTHTSKAYNAQYNDAKYVGWMYGPEGTTASTSKEQAQTNTADSDMKKLVDAWYKENIADKGLGEKVADAIFCNDRSTPGKSVTGWTDDTGIGYGTNKTAYGALARFLTGNNGTSLSARNDSQPQFKCPNKNDAFTVDDEVKGNGALTYPVGLITADEIVLAGSGKYNTSNSSYYLAKGSWYWSFSPRSRNSSGAGAFVVYSGGGLGSYDVSNASGAVAPVINLKAEYVKTMLGTGTMNDPYRSE